MIRISFLGDVSLNDKYNEYYNNRLTPFTQIGSYISKSDFIVANLECMSVGNDGENFLKKPRLKTDNKTLSFLKDIGITTVTLGHNHIYDNLESGFKNSIKKLYDLNIDYLGAGLSIERSRKPLVVEKNGIKIAYLNYLHKDTNPNIPQSAKIYINDFNIDNIKKDITSLREAVDYIVCLLHWGGRVEGGVYPDFNQPQIAYEIIDSGADIIIGHHSHTLQPYEVYKGKYIFYSLGNFCFADIYSDGELYEVDREDGCQSIVVNIEFHKTDYDVSIQHIENKNLFIMLDDRDSIKDRYIRRIKTFNLIKNKKYLWKIYWLKHKHYNPIKFYFFGNNRNPFKQLKKLGFKKIINYILKKVKGKI
jgi:poly-gamma-glutamate synthesis protein (capsule biosynthesis protein)